MRLVPKIGLQVIAVVAKADEKAAAMKDIDNKVPMGLAMTDPENLTHILTLLEIITKVSGAEF